MYQKILVPVAIDHGDRSTKALQVAQSLLAEGGAIKLLHVMEELPSYVMSYVPQGTTDQHHKEAMDMLTAMAKDVPHSSDADVVSGHAATTILEYGQKHGVDCIVIASHKPGFEDYFLGSTAARVVRHAQCSVHVLR